MRPIRVRIGSRRGGGRLSTPSQTYPDTYSGYGATRAESIGQPVGQFAYQAAQQAKAFNKQAATSTDEQ